MNLGWKVAAIFVKVETKVFSLAAVGDIDPTSGIRQLW